MVVIDINSCQEITIPDNFICCSICGEYKHPDSYKKPDQDKQSRTNCKECYETDYNLYDQMKANTKIKLSSAKYKEALSELNHKFALNDNSISVAELMKALKFLNPADKVFIGQTGYYAESDFADIFIPDFKEEVDGIKFYEIGHSSQCP